MPFLTARWSNLCLLTYAVPPAILEPRLPAGLALDTVDGRAFVSLVAFDFLDTRVLGVRWPGYRDFPEINLRFYVRHGEDRGVMFIREFVPARLVALLARRIYGEPYLAAPMTSRVTEGPDRLTVEHRLTFGGRENRLEMVGRKPCARPAVDGAEHFFKEHRWGFGGRPGGACVRYEVVHPVWDCFAVERYSLDWDWDAVYGAEFAFLRDATPYSVVMAAGSAVAVHPKGRPAAVVPAAFGSAAPPCYTPPTVPPRLEGEAKGRLMPRVATLTIDDKKIDLPVTVGSEGEVGIDITKLRAETGAITFDPALGNTGAVKSAITFIDGDKGILRYRGIPIEQLAEKSNFVETAYLLIFGKLPSRALLGRFTARVAENAHVHEGFKHHFEGFPSDAPPMAILSAMINTISCYNYDLANPDSDEEFEEAAARLISKIRTIAAYTYRTGKGLPYIYPDPKLGYVANFLHMMFSMPYAPFEVHPEVEDALDLILTLHADHEQNCSTSTVRMVGSSKANLFASCAAGVCALWGPLHGGANVEVLEMLEKIHTGGITADEYLKQVKEKKVLLYGFGHRVYKNFDPRARILKESSDKVLAKLGVKDPLLDIARRLEELALKDSYFVDRKLYPNVDFYSGIIMKAIGIPVSMFTVMFAIGRMPGWIAQWKEQRDEPGGRIARPRQVYTGPTKTDYVPLDARG